MIYLDNNATTPVDPEVSEAVYSSLKRDIGNPSSSHLAGRKTREVIDRCRYEISEFLGCDQGEIYFTSGGTESNNLAIFGLCLPMGKGHIITSVIEHPSVLNPFKRLEALGFRVSYVPVDNNGVVNTGEIIKALQKDTKLISIMHANNETGVLQPIEEIYSIAKANGIVFHTDAAQSIGKIPLPPVNSTSDLVTVVSHKFYGPKGIGALYARKGLPINHILYGAGHEHGLRPGTENTSGIVGLAKACHIASRDIKMRVSHTTRLREMLWTGLAALLPGIRCNGQQAARLPNTLNISIRGIKAVDLLASIGDEVAFSLGSACHEGKTEPSPVLKQMGLSDTDALSSLRLSLGKDNTEEEISKAIEIISSSVLKFQTGNP